MILIAWIAALVALLTSAAMLKDTALSSQQRRYVWHRLRHNWESLFAGHYDRIAWEELRQCIRFMLRAVVLVLIMGSSGVCVLMPPSPDAHMSVMNLVLRCALAAYLAMQVPCPWWKYITRGSTADAAANQKAPHNV